MLSLHSLSLSLADKNIFQNLSLTLLPSSIIYLHGQNGSGKTSLLRILASIQKPTSGQITYGKNSTNLNEFNKPYCTYIGHKIGIKQELSVEEHILFWAKLYQTQELISAAIVYFGLENLIEKKCYELSAGNQKKIALTKLILSQSKLWLLDEVDTNLDKKNQELLMNLIITHANNGGIIFLSSHNKPNIKNPIIINLEDY